MEKYIEEYTEKEQEYMLKTVADDLANKVIKTIKSFDQKNSLINLSKKKLQIYDFLSTLTVNFDQEVKNKIQNNTKIINNLIQKKLSELRYETKEITKEYRKALKMNAKDKKKKNTILTAKSGLESFIDRYSNVIPLKNTEETILRCEATIESDERFLFRENDKSTEAFYVELDKTSLSADEEIDIWDSVIKVESSTLHLFSKESMKLVEIVLDYLLNIGECQNYPLMKKLSSPYLLDFCSNYKEIVLFLNSIRLDLSPNLGKGDFSRFLGVLYNHINEHLLKNTTDDDTSQKTILKTCEDLKVTLNDEQLQDWKKFQEKEDLENMEHQVLVDILAMKHSLKDHIKASLTIINKFDELYSEYQELKERAFHLLTELRLEKFEQIDVEIFIPIKELLIQFKSNKEMVVRQVDIEKMERIVQFCKVQDLTIENVQELKSEVWSVFSQYWSGEIKNEKDSYLKKEKDRNSIEYQVKLLCEAFDVIESFRIILNMKKNLDRKNSSTINLPHKSEYGETKAENITGEIKESSVFIEQANKVEVKSNSDSFSKEKPINIEKITNKNESTEKDTPLKKVEFDDTEYGLYKLSIDSELHLYDKKRIFKKKYQKTEDKQKINTTSDEKSKKNANKIGTSISLETPTSKKEINQKVILATKVYSSLKKNYGAKDADGIIGSIAKTLEDEAFDVHQIRALVSEEKQKACEYKLYSLRGRKIAILKYQHPPVNLRFVVEYVTGTYQIGRYFKKSESTTKDILKRAKK